jgi:hypothetical protein
MGATCGGLQFINRKHNVFDAIKHDSSCFAHPSVPPDEQCLQSSNVAFSDVIQDTTGLRPTELNSYNPQSDFPR